MLLESRCKLLFGDESPARLHLADDAAEEDAGEAHHEETKNLCTHAHAHAHARTHTRVKSGTTRGFWLNKNLWRVRIEARGG